MNVKLVDRSWAEGLLQRAMGAPEDEAPDAFERAREALALLGWRVCDYCQAEVAVTDGRPDLGPGDPGPMCADCAARSDREEASGLVRYIVRKLGPVGGLARLLALVETYEASLGDLLRLAEELESREPAGS